MVFKTRLENLHAQTFASVAEADVVIVMGANPTEAHPVFGSRLKRRLREGAKLIVIDPRKIELAMPPISRLITIYQCVLAPMSLFLMPWLTVIEEGLEASDYINERCDTEQFNNMAQVYCQQKT